MAPRVRDISTIKSRLLKPAQTSIYETNFSISSPQLRNHLNNRGFNYSSNLLDAINLSCCDATLPGSSIATSEHPDKHHGSNHRYGYRRQYDDRSDFTFYVDAPKDGGPGYNVIWLFEQWMSYIVGENNLNGQEAINYSYRVNYPNLYRNNISITKFEKDANLSTLRSKGLTGQRSEDQNASLQYTFIGAFPISMSSMPVSYEQSQILKCTVSFTYIRYIARRRGFGAPSITADASTMTRQARINSSALSPQRSSTAPGVPNPGSSFGDGSLGTFRVPDATIA
jgi:hypothetical protein